MPTIWDRHKAVWGKKKLLREIYHEWYTKIVHDLTRGKTLEIGSGTGNFKEYYSKVITSDVEKLPGIDMRVDAHKLPFKKNSLGNIVMIDTLHHLADPLLFFGEANRVLKSGGRIIMVEPFPTVVSLFVYRKFHKEPFLFDIDYFKPQSKTRKPAWDSNQAIPYLIFFKSRDKFVKKMGKYLKIVKAEKISFLTYPLSGGFEGPQLIPGFLVPGLKVLEEVAAIFRDFLAFRCYLVIEKKSAL
jgi:ubiquinone/menaquinone biosynthesis C-methylase UbiE